MEEDAVDATGRRDFSSLARRFFRCRAVVTVIDARAMSIGDIEVSSKSIIRNHFLLAFFAN